LAEVQVIVVSSSAACLFDQTVAKELAGADYVTTNGVLHHIADDNLKRLLSNIELSAPRQDVLRARAVLLAGTAAFAKWT
jgi:hypothetical protein